MSSLETKPITNIGGGDDETPELLQRPNMKVNQEGDDNKVGTVSVDEEEMRRLNFPEGDDDAANDNKKNWAPTTGNKGVMSFNDGQDDFEGDMDAVVVTPEMQSLRDRKKEKEEEEIEARDNEKNDGDGDGDDNNKSNKRKRRLNKRQKWASEEEYTPQSQRQSQGFAGDSGLETSDLDAMSYSSMPTVMKKGGKLYYSGGVNNNFDPYNTGPQYGMWSNKDPFWSNERDRIVADEMNRQGAEKKEHRLNKRANRRDLRDSRQDLRRDLRQRKKDGDITGREKRQMMRDQRQEDRSARRDLRKSQRQDRKEGRKEFRKETLPSAYSEYRRENPQHEMFYGTGSPNDVRNF